ncbi:hypothetical protein DASC09_021940 [Saccharomycopsis crataegensis]|uniref:Carboxypeptidase n=1 Tax=Saccharomycopsis crataegensis TaxID=43959 RepID=A0AAV5QJG4_9ASCO|nr:hypothetical protein DASC09_021940 [Saccharomycopsis crataegensis]
MLILQILFLLSIGALGSPSFYTINSQAADKYRVDTLPGIDGISNENQPTMYAGQLDISTEDSSKIFFWLFQSRAVKHDKLVIWLNGGPGCSSMDGALMEVGPFRVLPDGQLEYNEGTWLHDADLLFIDQPKGTGLSTTNGTYAADLNQATSDFWNFYSNFVEIFDYYSDKEIYLAGESYAGQYIPYFAHGILENNAHLAKVMEMNYMVNDLKIQPSTNEDIDLKIPEILISNKSVNLQGLLIGNGYIYPDVQALSYIPFALSKGLLNSSDSTQLNTVYKPHLACESVLRKPSNETVFTFSHPICTDEILDQLLNVTRQSSNDSYTCHNMYDYTLQSPYPSCGMEWPFDLPQVTSWLQNDTVLQHLNIESETSWSECDGNVSSSLVNFNTTPSYFFLESLLDKIPIVLFNGGNDIICNHLGVENITDSLKWGNQTGWSSSTKYFSMMLNGENFGQVKSERNLTLMEIYNSSHMVPYDHSYSSRSVLNYLFGNYKNATTGEGNVIQFPNLNSEYSLGKFSTGFLVVICVCLVVSWAVILFSKFTNKSDYLRIDDE